MRWGWKGVLEFTDNVAGWEIFAREELGGLYWVHGSDRRMKVGEGVRTPNEASKMEPGGQVTMAHPTSLVPFQTTWVKCEKVGFWGL